MSNIGTITNVVLVAFFSIAYLNCDLLQKKPDIKKARQAEITGHVSDALASYSDLLLALTPVLTIPDYNRSKFLKPRQWQKEVENYLVWIQTAQRGQNSDFQQAFDGVMSCTREENIVNRIVRLKSFAISSDTFQNEWNRTFFAPMAKVDPLHKPLSSAAFQKNVSFVRLSSPKSYTYTIHLINPSTKQRIETTLCPETSVMLMAIPGEYLLLIRSTVTFESGQLWVSPYNAVKITVPEKPSLITADLITQVAR
ncbi:MAG TPA: hypothetical protein VHO70_17335 [Chitinispirillaceae bacterium]|nr:hypothetical protein [Chitinispirillaceae bacterium]